MYCTEVRKLRYGRSTRSSPVSPPHHGLRLKCAYVLRSAKGIGLVPAAARQGRVQEPWACAGRWRRRRQGAGPGAQQAATTQERPTLHRRTRIKQHAEVGLQQVGEAVEEPVKRSRRYSLQAWVQARGAAVRPRLPQQLAFTHLPPAHQQCESSFPRFVVLLANMICSGG